MTLLFGLAAVVVAFLFGVHVGRKLEADERQIEAEYAAAPVDQRIAEYERRRVSWRRFDSLAARSASLPENAE